MKKVNCQPVDSLITNIFLLIFSLIMITAFFIFLKNDNSHIAYTIIWGVISLACFIFTLYNFCNNFQYLYVKNNKFILKNLFGKMVELDIDNCFYEISTFIACKGRIYKNEKWICIYLNNKKEYFKKAFENSKKHKRIQVIYNTKTISFVKCYIN